MESFNLKRKKFLQKFLDNILFDGFSITAARQASLEIGEDINYHLILFPAGLTEIAEYYEEYSIDNMLQKLDKEVEICGTTKKIYTALIFKITRSGISKDVLWEISKFYLKPENAHLSIKASWSLCDAIWRFAGDDSIDYNYYTKRGLLFAVYNASIIYYLNDDSDSYVRTEEFIDKCLARIVSIAKAKSNIKSALPKLENIPIVRMFL